MEFEAKLKRKVLEYELQEQKEAAQRTEQQLANFNQPLQLTSKRARTVPQVTSTAHVEEIFEEETIEEETTEEESEEEAQLEAQLEAQYSGELH